ncbi:hypothetical protein BJ165DRAFT_1462718 [Panaeolus papilionaceus]|nr:hypothetical protein BJ165DRAFT_1462718 [Panaeolus papilionaceus]
MFSPQSDYAHYAYAPMQQIMPMNSLSLSFDSNITHPYAEIGSVRPALQDITHLTRNTPINTRSNIIKAEARRTRERTYQDADKLQTCHDIIEIMALTGAGQAIDEAFIQLQLFHFSLDSDMQAWIQTGSLKVVGSDRGRFASERRRNGHSAIVCLWCGSTFTGKHNLANHIRAHLDVHLSFCPNEGCTFSSTNTTLPSRHLAVCPRRPQQVAQLIQHSACSCANMQSFYPF